MTSRALGLGEDRELRRSHGSATVDPAKYRHVSVQLTRPAGVGADEALAALNRSFNPDDFHVVLNGRSLDLWLRQVDLRALSDAVAGVVATHSSNLPLEEIAPAVERIRSYGIHGRKRLYVGYNRERKVVGRKVKAARRGKHYYANDHGFEKAVRPFPDQFTDRILCGDSEEVLRDLPDDSVDLIFTSPPYNFGLDYDGEAADDDARDWESYFAKLFRVFDECIRVLKYGGRIVVNVQPLFSDYIPSHHMISNYFMRKRLIWKGEILWEKHNYNCKYTAWGSWKSPASPYLKYTWEYLEVFCKGDLKKSGRAADADIDAESFKQWVVARWSVAPERRMKQFGHPAMFPEELARRVMLLFSFRGDMVLDPFAGVGTTCVAARRNGRRFVGIDVSKEYCDTARARVADVQMALLQSCEWTIEH